MSNCSPSSTVSRRNPETWSRYRSKAKEIRADTVDSIFDAKQSPRGSAHGSEHPSVFQSNKISPPRIVPPHCGRDQPNLLLKKASSNDYETQSGFSSASKSSKIPYPFLQNLLEGHKKDSRFTKKMKFEVQPRKEVLKYNTSMYDSQRQDALTNRVNQIMCERNEIREFHRKLN